MKKFFFLTAAAAMLFAACQKTEVVYNEGPQEIAMFAVNNVATKDLGPVSDEVFPTDNNMEVAAYIVGTNTGSYFTQTTFSKGAGSNWTGGKYWPVGDAVINFFAVSTFDTAPITINSLTHEEAEIVLADNSETQFDLMYAAGQGKKTGNNATAVDMAFRHALSWICFEVGKNPTTTAEVVVKSIRLENAYYGGTYNITNSSYNAEAEYTSSNALVSGEWTTPTDQKNKDISDQVICETSLQPFGDGILVVPSAPTSFVITYKIGDSADLTYEHTITTPAASPGWEQAHKYTYKVTFGLNEIEIKPEVVTWTTEDGDSVTI